MPAVSFGWMPPHWTTAQVSARRPGAKRPERRQEVRRNLRQEAAALDRSLNDGDKDVAA